MVDIGQACKVSVVGLVFTFLPSHLLWMALILLHVFLFFFESDGYQGVQGLY